MFIPTTATYTVVWSHSTDLGGEMKVEARDAVKAIDLAEYRIFKSTGLHLSDITIVEVRRGHTI